ncbi:Man1-Src1p-C-terminal domain-containing protein [Cytidiella melzeri]|nr:Man1-Src1p-C-terminal domain-containing protein [Cytidiella melzeri]
MSKLSTSDVIAQGDYLEPDFNPASLTVAHLLGILGYHGVNYPSQHTKAKLVQLFNDEIKTNARHFKKERLSRQNSQASDEGITDGITGVALNAGRKGPRTRGASRRASSQLVDVPAPAPQRPDPVSSASQWPFERPFSLSQVKRRRSTAEPELGLPRRRRVAKPVAEALPEDTKTLASEDVDSGWEDNNIFQSGAESSSPIRPSPVKPRTRRGSVAPRKTTRKSMSVPPQFSPPSPTKEEVRKPRSTRQSSVKPPESTFAPVLPPEAVREPSSRSSRRKTGLVPEGVREASVEQEDVETANDEEVADEATAYEETPDAQDGSQDDLSQFSSGEWASDKQIVEVSERIAQGSQLVRRKVKKSPAVSNTLRFFLALVAMASLTSLYNYKTESAPIGFCATGTKSNEVLEALRTRRAAVLECNRENRTLLWTGLQAHSTQAVHDPSPGPTPGDTPDSQLVNSELCPPLSLLPIPPPDDCAPCPANAVCTSKSMTCETGYLLRPHPLLFFLSLNAAPHSRDAALRNTYTLPEHDHIGSSGDKSLSHLTHSALSLALDGFPGLGPVAFPPRCVEDPQRKRHIGALGKAVDNMLAAERGRRLCAGVQVKQDTGTQAEEAKKWGVEVDALKDALKRKTSPNMMGTFDDTWNEAIQQLLVWGGVFIGEDESGKRYLAHRTPQMDMACTVIVKARQTWEEWRKQVFGTFLMLKSLVFLRHQQARKAIENDRVAVLAQSALNLLRSQELAHYTDPVTAPQAYLPSLQLRDLILQDEPSVSTRRRLWAGVERVVEENTNVRTNLEEVEGGSEERVWRWVGSAGKSLAQDTGEAADDV